MLWEELTGDNFAKAVVDCGRVCIISLGVIERHGPHMPLGTDMINGQHIAAQAAQRESAIVFPPWFLGQIYEARCFPGTITIPPKMLVELMLSVYDEIGRNGLTKIITYVAHGGNNNLAPFLAQCQLHAPKPYQVYVFNYNSAFTDEQRAKWKATMETDPANDGHAGESETSIMMSHRPDLVKMDAVGDRFGERLGRMNHLKAGRNSIGWYANHPEHWAGDPRPASDEKGKTLSELQVESLATYIRAVKNDKVVAGLSDEFFRRERELRCDLEERKT